jgi:predicted nucleotidyltransferase
MNFDAAVQALSDAGVEFIIIGGWCAILHGSAHLTTDLDVFFSRKPENLRRLVQALAPYHPRLRDLPEDLPFLWEEATLCNGTIFTLTTDLGVIDLLGEVSGLGSFEEVEAAGAVTVEAFGRRVRTLDLKSLIQAKRAAGRDKDLYTLPELESLLEAGEP